MIMAINQGIDFLQLIDDTPTSNYPALIQNYIKNNDYISALFLLADLGTKIDLPIDYTQLASVIATEIKRSATKQNSNHPVRIADLINPEKGISLDDLVRFYRENFDDASAYNNLGITISTVFGNKLAETHFSYAYLLFKENIRIILNYAKVLESCGKIKVSFRLLNSNFKNHVDDETYVYNYLDFLVRNRMYKIAENTAGSYDIAANFKSSNRILESLGDLELCCGRTSAASSYYSTAHKLKETPKSVKQLALTNWAKGEITTALNNFARLYQISKNDEDKSMLLKFFHQQKDLNRFDHPFAILDTKIRSLLNYNDSHAGGANFYSGNTKVMEKLKQLVPKELLQLKVSDTQIFSGAFSHLDCALYKEMFFATDAIANRCFSCFKLELSFETASDLVIFISYIKNKEAFNNYISKGLKDDRPFARETYKTILYCSSVQELEWLENTIDEMKQHYNILSVTKRRGCSEFTNRFNEFQLKEGKVNHLAFQPSKWGQLEKKINELERPMNIYPANQKTIYNDFTLYEVMVACAWDDEN